MPRYILTEPVAADIRDINRYLRERSPQAAKIVRGKLRDAMRMLAEFPRIGHHRPDVADESLRFWVVYSYLIAYRPETKPLEVIRILHGAQDVRQIL
jgi:plasmid stabilization system protein ParE